MSIHRKFSGAVVAVAAALSLVCANGAPASAAAGFGVAIAPATGIPTASRYNVVPQCNASAGVATSLEAISYAVVGTAEAYSSDITPVIGTGVHCVVKDGVTGRVYGTTMPRAFPGPFAVSEGIIQVPFRSDPILCGYANALFSNNATATAKTSDHRC